MAKSPYLQLDKLTTLSIEGGYSETIDLTQLSSVFLLSACWYLRNRDIWQSSLKNVSDDEYRDILDMIEECESQLMSSTRIGEIISSVAELDSSSLLSLDGQIVSASDYPDLATAAPAAWLHGGNIHLPNMNAAGLFGAAAGAGDFIGENDVILDVSSIPAHTHIQQPHSHTTETVSSVPTAAGLEPALASLVTVIPTATGLTTAINESAGGGGAHNNIQRSLQCFFYIVSR